MDLNEVRQKMTQAFQMLVDDLATLKAGRATPALVENILVDAYQTRMRLVELAAIAAAGPNQLVITPFDQTIIKDIARSLSLDRDLGLSAVVEGNVIRLSIPPLTEERRQEFIKLLHQKLEAGRVMIRQIRHDKMAEFKRKFEARELNEDERFSLESQLQKMTDEFNNKIEGIGKVKEGELLSL